MAGSTTENQNLLPLTFGVEVEFLFGMRRNLEAYPEHAWLRTENLGMDERSSANLDSSVFEIGEDGDGEYEPVSMGLLQAAVVFGDHGGVLKVDCGQKHQRESFDKYSRWNLVLEEAVRIPQIPMDLSRWSDGLLSVPTEEEIDENWDWTGLELVSPALRVPDIEQNRPNGLVEVNRYLKLMTADRPPAVPYVFMAHPKNASIHVHIGVQPELGRQVGLPTDLIRHVAFLCLVFEDTITLLHHPERHSYPESKSRDYAVSNRKFLHAKRRSHKVHCCELGEPFSAEETFMKIFDYGDWDYDEDEQWSLFAALSSKKNVKHDGKVYMNDMNRFLFVNFENLAAAIVSLDGRRDGGEGEGQPKRTIEFRQHHGTLSGEDISEWVIFLTALVRAGERLKSHTPDGNAVVPPTLASKISERYKSPMDRNYRDPVMHQAAKYTQIWQQERRSLKQLFDLLELPVANRKYWWERAKKVRAELDENWADKSQTTCDNSSCPNKPRRDCEGWEKGELDNPPWDEADEDEDESVSMDIDNDVPEPEDLLPLLDTSMASNPIEDDSDDVPMEIDDDMPSPVLPTAAQ